MELLQKIKKEGITEEQQSEIYAFANHISKDTREEICPALFHIIMNSERGALKNELGRVIFHLQKNDRLETVIGLQKLLEAALRVAPEDMFKILKSSGEESQELAKKIEGVL